MMVLVCRSSSKHLATVADASAQFILSYAEHKEQRVSLLRSIYLAVILRGADIS